jgi:hypothetical protein
MSTQAQIVSLEGKIAAEKFFWHPFISKHGLADHPLFQMPRLVELAKSARRFACDGHDAGLGARRNARGN